jgi:hypothetical protein
MKRKLHIVAPTIVFGAAVVAAVLLAKTPWSEGEVVHEAAAGTVTYRLCDTVVEAQPLQGPIQDIVHVARWVEGPYTLNTLADNLEPTLKVELVAPSSGEPSSVFIDPASATVQQESYSSPAHEAALSAVLSTVRLEPLDPTTAPWPYTDKTQIPVERARDGPFEFRPADPGSGIVLSTIYADGDGWGSQSLEAANCQSFMILTWEFGAKAPHPGLTTTRDVHPDDEAAFQTFYDEVSVKKMWP